MSLSVSDIIRGMRGKSASGNLHGVSASTIVDGRLCSFNCINANVRTDIFSDAARTALAAVSFFVFIPTDPSYITGYSVSDSILLSSGTPLDNIGIVQEGSTVLYGGSYARSFSGLNALPGNVTREDFKNVLNNVLAYSGYRFGTSNLMRLWADIDGAGRLVLSIRHIDLVSTPEVQTKLIGLFFGDAPNGSTQLGVTPPPNTGVAAAALIIPIGQLSVTAPYAIPL